MSSLTCAIFLKRRGCKDIKYDILSTTSTTSTRSTPSTRSTRSTPTTTSTRSTTGNRVPRVPGASEVSIIKEKQQKSEISAKSAVLPTSLMSFFLVQYLLFQMHWGFFWFCFSTFCQKLDVKTYRDRVTQSSAHCLDAFLKEIEIPWLLDPPLSMCTQHNYMFTKNLILASVFPEKIYRLMIRLIANDRILHRMNPAFASPENFIWVPGN